MNKLYKHQQEIRKLCKKHNISDEVKVELLSIVSTTYNDGMEIGWNKCDEDWLEKQNAMWSMSVNADYKQP
jgi:hypothetical protein